MLLALVSPLAVALSIGSAQLTLDGETTTHEVTACAIEADGGMPARLLIEEMDLTLNVVHADHMQSISVIRDNKNWTASRLLMGGNWMNQGEAGEPIITQWGDSIRVEALLTAAQDDGEKTVTLIARCR